MFFIIVTKINLTEEESGECVSLKSENNLFRTMIHVDAKRKFAIEMNKKPVILRYMKTEPQLCERDESDELKSPFRISLIFNMEENKILLGDVRDKDCNILRSSDDVGDLKDGWYLKLNELGKFEVIDDKNQKKEYSTNFTGNQPTSD